MKTIESDDDDSLLDSVDLDSASDELARLAPASNDDGYAANNKDERQRYRRQMDARRRLEQLMEERALASQCNDWGE